jgi:hypothetical protein
MLGSGPVNLWVEAAYDCDTARFCKHSKKPILLTLSYFPL